MKKTIFCAVLACAAMFGHGAGDEPAVLFSDDFKDADAFAKNWDLRVPTRPENGILAVGKNHYTPFLKTSIEGKDKVTLKVEVATADRKGFGGVNMDGILFFLRDGKAVTVFKSPDRPSADSRLKNLPEYEDGKFYCIEVTRTKAGDDYEYLYKVDGNEITTIKGQKIPPSNKVGTAKSQTDVKFKNFRLLEAKAP